MTDDTRSRKDDDAPVHAGPYSIGSDVWPGLSKLAEEAGEVVQVIGKIIGLGGAENYTHWDGSDVRKRLEAEIADLTAAIAFVIEANELDELDIDGRARLKGVLFRQWHDQQGTPSGSCGDVQ